LNDISVGARVNVADIKDWFKAVDNLKGLATAFNNEGALQELEEQIERMNWVYKALTGDTSPMMLKGASMCLGAYVC
jgi:hypothetical protein